MNSSANGRYIGRFAPSPTGPLHAGSLVAALASWLDARTHHGGRWLVRIEDIDAPRCTPGVDQIILQQLAACGLWPDEVPQWQSTHSALYQEALAPLVAQGMAYPCACSRKDIEQAHAAQGHTSERHTALPYPGTCREGLRGLPARAWRFNVHKLGLKMALTLMQQARAAPFLIAKNPSQYIECVEWHDRRLGIQQQNTASTVGDFVLQRADGLWAYQLAVVVDDAAQGITHVVRGEDLADNTPRQILLQQALGLPTPDYLHTPLVRGADGEKLSKQHGAPAIDSANPLQALSNAAALLGLPSVETFGQNTVADALALWVKAWGLLYNRPCD